MKHQQWLGDLLHRIGATGYLEVARKTFGHWRDKCDDQAPMTDGGMPHIRGRLVGGCFKPPCEFANKNELIRGTAYLWVTQSYQNKARVTC